MDGLARLAVEQLLHDGKFDRYCIIYDDASITSSWSLNYFIAINTENMVLGDLEQLRQAFRHEGLIVTIKVDFPKKNIAWAEIKWTKLDSPREIEKRFSKIIDRFWKNHVTETS